MKKLEILLWVALISLAVSRSIFFVSFVYILLTGLLLAIYYLFASFLILNNIRLRSLFVKGTFQSIVSKKVAISLVQGFGYSMVSVSILFELLCLPGSIVMLSMSIILLLASSIISVSKSRRDKSGFYRNIINRNIFMGIICIGLFTTFFLPIETRKSLFPLPADEKTHQAK